MQELANRVAVVTGAASGIGAALVDEFCRQGMKVVLADVEADALRSAVAACEAAGHDVIGVITDVADAAQVDELARRTLEHYGAVHLVCNNAGVIDGGLSWEMPLDTYRWIFDVNVFGVLNGIRTFVPVLRRQGGEAHIVNTSSMAALTSMPYVAAYHMSKHAVLTLSECLYHELALAGSSIGVSVLCPEGIATRIHEAERNRPGRDRVAGADPDDGGAFAGSPERRLVLESLSSLTEQGVTPAVVARRVLVAIREKRFYVLAEDVWRDACNLRLDDLREARNPTFAPPT
jgi:NAD(P)-dependent dehydrogenase (short-subunit alcohol dehydrogenase family)